MGVWGFEWWKVKNWCTNLHHSFIVWYWLSCLLAVLTKLSLHLNLKKAFTFTLCKFAVVQSSGCSVQSLVTDWPFTPLEIYIRLHICFGHYSALKDSWLSRTGLGCSTYLLHLNGRVGKILLLHFASAYKSSYEGKRGPDISLILQVLLKTSNH